MSSSPIMASFSISQEEEIAALSEEQKANLIKQLLTERDTLIECLSNASQGMTACSVALHSNGQLLKRQSQVAGASVLLAEARGP